MDRSGELDGRLKAKQASYESLDSLLRDELDDGEDDQGRQASLQAMRNATKRAVNRTKRLTRSASGIEPTVVVKSTAHIQQQRSKSINVKSKPPVTLIKGQTFSGGSRKRPDARAAPPPPPSSSDLPKILGKRKRKRGSIVKLVPDEQQIFKGLVFYFFPNNDSNPARALRIAKALEYGASWQRDWNADITHIIVDKMMNYSMLTGFLKVDKVPSGVVVVSENYPAESISYRHLLDPTQPHFRVKGDALHVKVHDRRAVQEKAVVPAHPSPSLELKPAGKNVMTRRPETPKSDRPRSSPAGG